VERYCCF